MPQGITGIARQRHCTHGHMPKHARTHTRTPPPLSPRHSLLALIRLRPRSRCRGGAPGGSQRRAPRQLAGKHALLAAGSRRCPRRRCRPALRASARSSVGRLGRLRRCAAAVQPAATALGGQQALAGAAGLDDGGAQRGQRGEVELVRVLQHTLARACVRACVVSGAQGAGAANAHAPCVRLPRPRPGARAGLAPRGTPTCCWYSASRSATIHQLYRKSAGL